MLVSLLLRRGLRGGNCAATPSPVFVCPAPGWPDRFWRRVCQQRRRAPQPFRGRHCRAL